MQICDILFPIGFDLRCPRLRVLESVRKNSEIATDRLDSLVVTGLLFGLDLLEGQQTPVERVGGVQGVPPIFGELFRERVREIAGQGPTGLVVMGFLFG